MAKTPASRGDPGELGWGGSAGDGGEDVTAVRVATPRVWRVED